MVFDTENLDSGIRKFWLYLIACDIYCNYLKYWLYDSFSSLIVSFYRDVLVS